MKFELIGEVRVPKIGFGTWSIGGGSFANRSRDAESLAILRSVIELGYNHFDTAESYANGHCEELVGQALRESGVRREDMFITSKVSPEHLGYSDVLKSCEGSLRRLRTEYLDLYLIHWPRSGMDLAEPFQALSSLVRDGKVRHLGVSNFDVKLLEESRQLAPTLILTDQVPYSLKDRTYSKNGVLEYCQEHDILLTAYSPFEQGHLRADTTLREVAAQHSATPHQIALAWLISQPRVITIPMSRNPRHQYQNLDAADIALTDEEMQQLR